MLFRVGPEVFLHALLSHNCIHTSKAFRRSPGTRQDSEMVDIHQNGTAKGAPRIWRCRIARIPG